MSDEAGDTDVIEMPMPLGILAGHLFQRAVEYTETLEILARQDNAPRRPAGFIFAHALEVGLKAFLAANGVPKKELQRTYGHNLRALMDQADTLGLPPVPNLQPFAYHMHEMNQDFDLRYPSEWHLSLPNPKDCLPIAEGLLAAISVTVETVKMRATVDFLTDTQRLKGKRIRFSDKPKSTS